jgi:hypothetical protein
LKPKRRPSRSAGTPRACPNWKSSWPCLRRERQPPNLRADDTAHAIRRPPSFTLQVAPDGSRSDLLTRMSCSETLAQNPASRATPVTRRSPRHHVAEIRCVLRSSSVRTSQKIKRIRCAQF